MVGPLTRAAAIQLIKVLYNLISGCESHLRSRVLPESCDETVSVLFHDRPDTFRSTLTHTQKQQKKFVLRSKRLLDLFTCKDFMTPEPLCLFFTFSAQPGHEHPCWRSLCEHHNRPVILRDSSEVFASY